MALQQLKSASFSGYIPFSESPSGDVDFGSSDIKTCGSITADGYINTSCGITAGGSITTEGDISANGSITANDASFGSCGAVTIDSCGNIDAEGNISTDGGIDSCGGINSCSSITAKYFAGSSLQLDSPRGTILHVTPGSGSSEYYAMIRLTSGAVVKSGYICPDSQGILHLEPYVPYPNPSPRN